MNEDVFGIPTEEKTTAVRKTRKRTASQIAADKTRTLYNWMNIFAFLAMISINILANALPLGGHTSEEVSDMYPSLFTPSGITFSIWGIIYTLTGIVFIRQLLSGRKEHKRLTDDIGSLFAVSCALNIGWILCWHFGRITGATLMIFALLVDLIFILILVRDDRMMSITFGIYTAWIIIASVASIFVEAVYLGNNLISAGGETLAVFAAVMAGVLLIVISITGRNWTFAAVGIWAYTGILVKQIKTFNGKYPVLIGATVIMITAMVIALSYFIINEVKTDKTSIKGVIAGQSPEVLPG
ncbi:MAG: TspO/MBR family protein [Lachnospiraceae bacterium]|nr:TspO/MBR family protein [Lachnospiraceae bacterium]